MTLPSDAQISAVFRLAASVETADSTRTVARFVAPGSVTRGEFGLFRWEMAPNAGGPDPHIHHTFSESFYVLQGRVRLFDGATWVEAVAGDFLYVPRNGIHAFRNESAEPAAMLILFAPGAPREEYFKAVADNARTGRTMTDEERTAFLARHDQFMVEVPSEA
jgi:mannose-6-phosphate isomerase-like protein (cupin superfamily)